ncbi:hypothetical protein [Thalassotalea aquiviva]|uniref:hypothetical protein n=1 Tax=Thalassotalea aquiviva TaxID=3242415 RepID=UPI00352AA7FF
MFFTLFKSEPLIDEASSKWLEDTVCWIINEFGEQYFANKSQLILPTNNFYPGQAASVQEMAQLMFDKTLAYAGMKNWPIKLVPLAQFKANTIPKFAVNGSLLGESSQIDCIDFRPESKSQIELSYHPQQINQPQDLITHFAQQFAAILVAHATTLPPGGDKTLPQTIEVLACFMGFGVMFANTAYQFKGGCGSCYNKQANRQAALPEQEAIYALALYSQMKNIAPKEVKPHLKKHLTSDYKRALSQIKRKVEQNQLNALPNLLIE